MNKFLSLVHAAEDCKIPLRIGEANFEKEIKSAIVGLVDAHQGPLIRFLPLILDKLLQIMVRPPLVAGQIGKNDLLNTV